jgi:5-methylcytosine-specific restriction endonuclease McrA
MQNLQTLVEGYQQTTYRRVQRNDLAYQQTWDYISSELDRKVKMYREQFEQNQTARLIRDDIDHLIRRYHGYCIEGSIGSHYQEQGVVHSDSVFEHVIPASNVRDMLIEGRLTVRQALNTPTCLVKKSSDKLLRQSGLASTSPNNYFFFKRYSVLNSQFVTYNGETVDNLNTWSLEDHYRLFNITE